MKLHSQELDKLKDATDEVLDLLIKQQYDFKTVSTMDNDTVEGMRALGKAYEALFAYLGAEDTFMNDAKSKLNEIEVELKGIRKSIERLDAKIEKK